MTSGNKYKWVMLALLSCAFFFHQADRVLFGLLTIPIQEDLHLTDLQIGVVNTSLFCTLAVTTPLMIGALSDKCGMRGFEIGFAILGVAYVAGAVAVFASFLWTFKRNRVSE